MYLDNNGSARYDVKLGVYVMYKGKCIKEKDALYDNIHICMHKE